MKNEKAELRRLISDIHKEARGRRPTVEWMDWFNFLPLSYQDEIVEGLLKKAEERREEEQNASEKAAYDFRCSIRYCMRMGAADVDTALRWLTQSEVFYSDQGIEHWVWNEGFLFTKTGKETVMRLIRMAHAQIECPSLSRFMEVENNR